MQNTTRPTVVVLESISPDALFGVNGGCHKKRSSSSSSSSSSTYAPVLQVLQLPQAPVPPQPQPVQQALPPQEPISRGPDVSTSVSIS